MFILLPYQGMYCVMCSVLFTVLFNAMFFDVGDIVIVTRHIAEST